MKWTMLVFVIALVTLLVSSRKVQLERTNRRTRKRLFKYGRVNRFVRRAVLVAFLAPACVQAHHDEETIKPEETTTERGHGK